MPQKMILDNKAIDRAIIRISYEIVERNKGAQDVCIIGILSRGMELGNRIAQKISKIEGVPVSFGFLDITPFRDDRKYASNQVDQSNIPFSIQHKRVVLVDDVLYTGRTMRSAIDALFMRGRAKTVHLAVLIDRGHRELPFRADFVGKNLPTAREDVVRVQMEESDGVSCVTLETT